MMKKIIIIAGGYDKHIPYEPLGPVINDKVKVLILLGDTAPKIEKAVVEAENYNENEITIINVTNMEEAVEAAVNHAEKRRHCFAFSGKRKFWFVQEF